MVPTQSGWSSRSNPFAFGERIVGIPHASTAARAFDPPLERVEIPFRGRAGEGDRVVGYLRIPAGGERVPLLITWGGIDTYKEERRTDRFLERGVASLAIDMPGVGEAPLRGSIDAERMWDDILVWVTGEARLDATHVAVWGLSTGGYWAAKLAHTHADRLVGAVDHGGPVHDSFAPAWIERAQDGEYPFELAETLAWAFGGRTLDNWIGIAPGLSLLDQGLLDRPSCPLLLVNGTRDSVFSIADMYTLLAHGSPKTARFSDTGHMGYGPGIEPMIVDWLCARLLVTNGTPRRTEPQLS